MVTTLAHAGASVDAINHNGLTPADCALFFAFFHSRCINFQTGSLDPLQQQKFFDIVQLIMPERGTLDMIEIGRRLGYVVQMNAARGA